MDKIIKFVEGFTQVRKDDNFFDRLSNHYTVLILVTFAMLVGANIYVGNTIECWAPNHFTKTNIKYMNTYCWVRNTYAIDWEDQIPRENEHEKRDHLPYYQWVPFILLGMAVFYYLPKAFWNALNQKSGVDADDILAQSQQLGRDYPSESKDKKLDIMARQLDRMLGMTNTNMPHRDPSAKSSRSGKYYLSVLYMVVKVFYIANVIGQFFVLNHVLSTQFSEYGITYLNNEIHQTEVRTLAFPKVTFCDMNIRRLGNTHRYTVQCTLPVNMYTEKMFLFLWFWMAFVAAMTILDFFTWVTRFASRADRKRFIKNHLPSKSYNSHLVGEFVDYLGQDGTFMLRLIAHNSSNVTVTEIIGAWLRMWTETYRRDAGLNPDAPSSSSFSGSEPHMYPQLDKSVESSC